MDTQVFQAVQVLQRQAASLLVYQSVLQDDVGQAFLAVLHSLQSSDSNGINCLHTYGRWFSALAAVQQSWQAHILTQILFAENSFTQQAQQADADNLPTSLLTAVRHDLSVLQELYSVDPQRLSEWVQAAASLSQPLPAWHSDSAQFASNSPNALSQQPIWRCLESSKTWADLVNDLALHYRQHGTGQFARFRAFRWQSSELVGIAHPDPVLLEELVGYETQRDLLLKNTEALLAGYPALHVLLYGSRGSGKSSLVKSLLHQFGHQGLRIVEVAKSDLKELPNIIECLRGSPQKFIIFVDDLSFEEDDDAYKALKVILEGNLTARPQNIVVYATSNRRHLIREFFGDRPRPSDADEIHSWDTVQEKLSFSDRFGLTLTFEPADQSTYLAIVHHLARLAHISLPSEELEFRALQWSTRHNGRSGRTARQFIDFLRAELASQALSASETNRLSTYS